MIISEFTKGIICGAAGLYTGHVIFKVIKPLLILIKHNKVKNEMEEMKDDNLIVRDHKVGMIFSKMKLKRNDITAKDLQAMGIAHIDDFYELIAGRKSINLDAHATEFNAHKIAAWLKVDVKELV